MLKWPGQKLVLPAIPAKIVRATPLTGGKASFAQTSQGIELTVPVASRDAMDTIIALELDSPAGAIGTVAVAK
ncbi:hypothetical protein ACHMW6_12870 [Pseudoduganella sp. UC29_106]|uniref:hypothetical protein n=1 Tax=Pseudoduganella sp. UC29_106 TaxID=3374553 RepID=UPI00375749B8